MADWQIGGCRVDHKSKYMIKTVPDIQLHGEVDFHLKAEVEFFSTHATPVPLCECLVAMMLS